MAASTAASAAAMRRHRMEVLLVGGCTGTCFAYPPHAAASHRCDRSLPMLIGAHVSPAGAGGTLGRSFHELADLIDAAGGSKRLGLCLDSCHLFASGFDITTEEGLAHVLDDCVKLIGLKRLGSLHLNDSQAPLGSNRDRHANVGEGQ